MSDKKIYLACDCHSVNHLTRYSYHELAPEEIYVETHLTNYKGFWKRVWAAIKYTFGYRSIYGDFDCLIMSPTSVTKLRNSLNTFLHENDQHVKKEV